VTLSLQQRRFRCIRASAVRASKKVQLSWIGSWLRAFQRAIDEVCVLTLTPPNGGSKSEFVCRLKTDYLIYHHHHQIWHAAAVCQGPWSNSTRRKYGCGPGLGELPEIRGFPFNISSTAEASDFKFGTQLRFAKAHHKITCRKRVGVALSKGSSPKFGGFASIFTQWLKLATSSLVHCLGLPRPIIKSHP